MAKRYIRINWQNKPSTATPLSAEFLNKMDKGIDDCDTAIEDLYGIKINSSSIVQTDQTNDATKIPSSAVTYAHGQAISTLNSNLAVKEYNDIAAYKTSNVESVITGSFNIYGKVAVFSALLNIASTFTGTYLFTGLPVTSKNRTEFIIHVEGQTTSRGNTSGNNIVGNSSLAGKTIALEILFITT